MGDMCIISKDKLEQKMNQLKNDLAFGLEMPMTVTGDKYQRKLIALMKELKYPIK